MTAAGPGGDPWIVRARRTPIGTAGHALAGCSTTDLAAPLLADAAAALDGRIVDEVVLGNCTGPGGNVARVAALAAGLPPGTPAVTVDRQCGSGLEAVLQAAALIRAGDADVVLAGGVEAASTAPWRHWPGAPGGPPGERYTRAPFAPPGHPDPDMGAAADDLARRRGYSRDRLDRYAEMSHARAAAAQRGGVFAAEVVPVAGIARDDRPRTGLTLSRLARLPPAFTPDGTSTAGNSCGVSDGAALLTVVDGHRPPEQLPGEPRPLRVVSAAAVGGDPALPGAALAPAVRAALAHPRARARGLTTASLGAVEITEAFAAVAVAALDDLDLDPELVCRDGGAIGLGHPWGASGALLLVRLAHRMSGPAGARWGLAACAVGGGQGLAMVVERVDG
ncbi:thiolase family protein [Nakamurella endophytica]|uniref:Probable acetyl-CoA acetyltransferase n=1 Tax=Nakamurella endophytica TaxID=1748367 RepID=A0A917SNN9_9ACTN|nr:thiolase family protein [Nakamurella endophytica]GGL88258.1 acetyl-CoA acetyltransferase [Nakamurella endophytica]